MGKKAKQKKQSGSAAKARAGAVGAGSLASGSADVGGNGGIPKKVRCVCCLALIKDTAKSHACPGCSELYCWRCEKKQFFECPNGDDCADPAKNCSNCITGSIMCKELASVGVLSESFTRPCDSMEFQELWNAPNRKAFEDIMARRQDLTAHSVPWMCCGEPRCTASRQSVYECLRCAEDPSQKSLIRCCICEKIRCIPCSTSDLVPRASWDAASNLQDEIDESEGIVPNAAIERFGRSLATAAPDGFAQCPCGLNVCHECFSFVQTKCYSKVALIARKKALTFNGDTDADINADASIPKKVFRCSSCYWSAKPCTNPTCPNEVGIPTKRCGGCHLDRYCSVECQAAAYPDHIQKCEKIQAKVCSWRGGV